MRTLNTSGGSIYHDILHSPHRPQTPKSPKAHLFTISAESALWPTNSSAGSCTWLNPQNISHRLQPGQERQVLHHKVNYVSNVVGPRYLGMTLDTFRSECLYQENTSNEVRSRVVLMRKHPECNWGKLSDSSNCNNIPGPLCCKRYCAPVWSHGSHTKLLDPKSKRCARLITEALKSTPVYCMASGPITHPSTINR